MDEEKKSDRAQSLSGGARNAYVPRDGLVAHRQEIATTSGPGSSRAARRGRIPRGLPLWIVFLGLVVWFSLPGEQPPLADDALGPAIQSTPTEPAFPGSTASGSASRAADDLPGEETPKQPGLPKFDGRGSIRGLVSPGRGASLPERFTIHVGPSDSLFGRERAESRATVSSEAEFAIDDLPLGGYDVWIEAPGQNSRRHPVLLSQSASSPYLILRLAPTGFIDGFVVNQDGRPAQDLPVTLVGLFSEERYETRTRADGFYLVEDVQDGEYRLLFGPLNAPLVPARELVFQAPSMRFPKIELPPAVDILIHTTDREGRPVGDVTLSGFGKPSGRLELVSDFAGLGWARNLPPGRYRVAARNPDGLKAKMTWEVKDEPGQEFWIAVR